MPLAYDYDHLSLRPRQHYAVVFATASGEDLACTLMYPSQPEADDAACDLVYALVRATQAVPSHDTGDQTHA